MSTDRTLKETITEAMKAAMRAQDKQRLGAVRLILSEVKRIEVDERIVVDDARLLAILDKMLKQRRDSIQQFQAAGRTDLVDIEEAEVQVIQSFMPTPLTQEEITQLITQAVVESGAKSQQDMGKIMGLLKSKMQGRVDMTQVSAMIKQHLSTLTG